MDNVINLNPDKLVELSSVIIYYTRLGFKYIDVPWLIKPEISDYTAPEKSKEHFMGYTLNASAEQGFLSLDLQPGKYVSWSVAFREEPIVDETHKLYFYKVELYDNQDFDYKLLAQCAFDMYIKMGVKNMALYNTDDGYDIYSEDIELGSYGYRKVKDKEWAYGTGFVQPRVDIAKARLLGV